MVNEDERDYFEFPARDGHYDWNPGDEIIVGDEADRLADVEPDEGCPKCDSPNVRCTGSDSVMNVGSGLEHVSWWVCEACGERWSEE